MGSKFHNGDKKKDKLLLKSYIDFLVPRVYASIASSLWSMGWTAEEIQDMFADSQERWRESTRDGWDMLRNVQDVTGIEVEYFKEKGNIV